MKHVISLTLLAKKDKAIEKYSPEDLYRYHELIVNILNKVVLGVHNYLNKILSNVKPKKELNPLELEAIRLETINNAIVITLRRYFTLPLIPPVIGDKSKVDYEVSIPEDFLYLWVLIKPLSDIIPVVDEIDKDYFKNLVGKYGHEGAYGYENVYKDFLNKLTELIGKDFMKVIMSIPKGPDDLKVRLRLLKLPADTRPGLNLAKLIPHLLTTSAISCLLYHSQIPADSLKDPEVKLEFEVLRLAALLHDIGKPYSWAQTLSTGKYISHVEPIEKIIEQIGLANVLNKGLAEALVKLIKYHHNPDKLEDAVTIDIADLSINIRLKKLGEIIANADKASSGIDRVKVILKDEQIKTELRKIFNIDSEKTLNEMYFGIGSEIWNIWLKISDNSLEKANELVFRALANPYRFALTEEEIKEGKKYVLLGADVKGIQNFIYKESLRGVIASSLVVNLVTLYAIPRSIIEALNIPLECILYSGGGFTISLAPSDITESKVEEMKKIIQEIVDKEGDLVIDVVFAFVPFEKPWYDTSVRLSSHLSTRKLIYSPKPEELLSSILLGYEKLCDVCYFMPAEVKYYDMYLDRACLKLLNFGSSWYIHYKLDTLDYFGYEPATKLKEDIREVMERLMPWLSGAERWTSESWDLAVVKIDGNFMGCFMTSSINISEAMFRSMIIDLSLKYGILSALERIRDVLGEQGEDAVVRIFSGILYAGGDDLLAIMPSYLAIPFSLKLATVFWDVMGGSSQLSIGIAVGRPKHDIWNLIDSANALLEKCKGALREDDDLFNMRNDIVALMSFMHSDRQLFKGEVGETFSRYSDFTVQPLILYSDEVKNEVEGKLNNIKLLTTVFNINEESNINEYVDELIRCIGDVRKAKRVASTIHELFSICAGYSAKDVKDMIKVIASYVAKQVAEMKGETGEVGPHSFAKIIREVIIHYDDSEDERKKLPLLDIYLMAKIIRGGR